MLNWEFLAIFFIGVPFVPFAHIGPVQCTAVYQVMTILPIFDPFYSCIKITLSFSQSVQEPGKVPFAHFRPVHSVQCLVYLEVTIFAR